MTATLVSCRTEALNDWIFDDHGNVIAPGGRGVAEWMSSCFNDDQYVSTEPQIHSDYGWEFTVTAGRKQAFILVAGGDEADTMNVWVRPTGVWNAMFGRNSEMLVRVKSKVLGLLEQDERFEGANIAPVKR
jgi:hypothetical protein